MFSTFTKIFTLIALIASSSHGAVVYQIAFPFESYFLLARVDVEESTATATVVMEPRPNFVDVFIEFDYFSTIFFLDVRLPSLPAPPFAISGISVPESSTLFIYQDQITLTPAQHDYFVNPRSARLMIESTGSVVNQIDLYVIPEPSICLLTTLLLIVLIRRKRDDRLKYGE